MSALLLMLDEVKFIFPKTNTQIQTFKDLILYKTESTIPRTSKGSRMRLGFYVTDNSFTIKAYEWDHYYEELIKQFDLNEYLIMEFKLAGDKYSYGFDKLVFSQNIYFDLEYYSIGNQDESFAKELSKKASSTLFRLSDTYDKLKPMYEMY